MDVPPGLLAIADQVYAGMLNDLWSLDAPILDPADFAAEFESRMREALGPEWPAWPGEPGADT